MQFLPFLVFVHITGVGTGGVQQELRVDGLAFFYWPGQEGAARALAEAAAAAPRMPGLPGDILARGGIEVYLAPDRASFDSLAPGAPDWIAGVAFPEGDRIVLPTFAPSVRGAPLPTVLRHELAHVALQRFLGSGVPRWYHEGYAQLASGSWHSGDAWALRFAILMGRVPSLEALSLEFDRERLDVEHAYLLAYTAVEYLYRLGGPAGFARLLERWRDGGDLDLALRRTYGITLWQFERLWRRRVRDQYGWLLVASQAAVFWTVLTILLLALGYWKRKRSRLKLAALEALVQAQRDRIEEGEGGLEDEGP